MATNTTLLNNTVKIEIDEVSIVKNDILNTIFCDYDDYEVPTYLDFVNVGELLPHWQLCEDYQDYSFDSLKNKIDELCENFFTTLNVLNSYKENVKKQKKYNYRESIEYGIPFEVIRILQKIHEEDNYKELDGSPQMIVLQANITTDDVSSIEVVLDCEFDEIKLLKYLKNSLDVEFQEEVESLIEVIKEAKADKRESLYLYDC